MDTLIVHGLTNTFRPCKSTMCLDLPIYVNGNGNSCMGMLNMQPHVNIRYVNNVES
jgi:hypothetical protein